jgi:glycosyltransferase involved in cell wall biosynthesis
MKVAIVTTRHGAQDDRIYYKQALSLAKRMDVTMIAPDDGDKLDWPPAVTYRPIPRRRSALGRLWSLVEAVRGVRREKPDFCHVHDLDLALAIPFIRLLTKAKIVYDSHEVFTREDLILNGRLSATVGKWVARLVEMAENGLVRASHHVVTAVDPVGRAFRGVRVPLSTVFNYPPLSVFETKPERVEMAAEQYRGRLPIVYQGTMSRDRGLFHMLEAVALVRRKEPRILLRLIGMRNGELKAEVKQRVSELTLGDNVEIAGWLRHDEIAVAMKTSLIGLVPLQPNEKYNRTLPIKLLEYMACGLPVVAARLPLMEKYVNDCQGGLLYDSTRPEELARCVLELLANPQGRRQMGGNGLRAVRERWNWDKMEEMLFGIYESLGARFTEARS